MRRRGLPLACAVLSLGTLLAAHTARTLTTPQDTFARVLQDVSAYRGRGFTLPQPPGAPARYARRLENVSEQRYAGEAAALSGFEDRLATVDRGALSLAAQTDAEILSRQLRDRLAELRFRAFEIPIGSREGFHFDLAVLPDRYTFDTVSQYDDYIAKLQSFGEHAAQRIALLRAGLTSGRTLPRDVLAGYDEPVAAQIYSDITRSPLHRPFAQVPAALDPADRTRIMQDGPAAIRASVMPALQAYLDFLRREYVPGARTTLGLADLPDGDAFYRHRIRMHTTLDLSPKEVHDTGLREVARLRAQMEQVKARAGFTGTIAEFMALLQTDPRFTVKTESEYLQAVSWAAKRMDGELPRLFSLLPRTPYGVRAMPERIALRQSAGYYDAGAADGTRAGWVNINTSDLRARPLYVVESLAFHEGVPGHHLQIMRTQENTALSGFRRGIGITAYTEGWGLYAERLGREVGFFADPYSDFGRLTYEIWRAVRLVVDSGVHAFGWTRARAIAYMAENTGFQAGPSTAETDRHITEAGQGLAYTFGMLKILDLRAAAEARLGARFDIKAFHEAILKNGPLPLDMLEREVRAWIDTAAGRSATVDRTAPR